MSDRDGKGLTLYVYRNPLGDCTLGGVSSNHIKLTLVGVVDYARRDSVGTPPEWCWLPRDCQVVSPGENTPPVWLVKHKHGANNPDVHLIPSVVDGDTVRPDLDRHYMHGGNFADSSDSRVTKLFGGNYAVRIHDRHETR